ncbi:fumarate reductase cytochrome b subunit [Helicobacter mustelae]|uniref:Fumarate reductase cytochrome b subunit n=1 Tax=Helicobacter mustelae (strain ATCC 43772 / CCUG 25715 / CIP 103759 / LMG 18044 / NCTC 12198 / R85-136P) TaxID=679897 RepID=D3UJG5_HELM1|nr:fumarate reductase cytochrome b subunit [Helicobacter mustelae]CBG40641.1 fumarate reductase cytochrome B subunit [Helicobacter mustelae 12198]SQH72139.1 fumarate reductase cytochrome subunit B [Helicobacter mustelae]STP13284.1 fumarate reductase cytochrome subunit B [Helicobacter mustelae]
MQDNKIIEGYLGITQERKHSRLPAKLDYLQSATGLFLGIFMIAHMFFVSSILLGQEAMYKVTKFFEGSMFFSENQPMLVSIVAVIVIIAFVTHAFLALRKFPINYRQFKILRTHKHLMKHSDTSLWFVQAGTGFALFFLASVHLFVVLTQPDTIGPNTSAYRFVHQHFWILYIVLLFAVELHGSIGLYRLCIKWGWFEKLGLKNLRAIKWVMSVFFIVLGLLSFAAYVKIGLHQEKKSIEYYKMVDDQMYGKESK